MFKLAKKNKRGFTLLETFVAVTILIIAVIGPLALLVRGITDGNYAKNEVTAFYIAQEGLELVINRRDANQFKLGPGGAPPGHTWLNGLNACNNNNGCELNVGDQEAQSCGGNGCGPYEFYDKSENAANFVRKIKITPGENRIVGTLAGETNPIPPGQQIQRNQAEVEVTVTWKNKNAPRTLILKDVIYSRPIQEVL